MNRRKFTGMALASAAAGLFAAAPTQIAVASEGDVMCWGVNTCKGHNDCKTANNDCKGMGSCKGQGFVSMSKHACDAVGGTVK